MASGFGRITLSLPNLSKWITPNTIAFQMKVEILSKFMSRICILLFYKCSDNAYRCEITFLLKKHEGFMLYNFRRYVENFIYFLNERWNSLEIHVQNLHIVII